MKLALIQKLRHGAIWQAMRERGWNQRQLAEHLGMSKNACGDMLAFKWIPQKPDIHLKLMELTGIAIDDLFPAEAYKALKAMPTTHEEIREVTPQLLRQAVERLSLPSPEQQRIDAEPGECLHAVLKTLNPKEQHILERRFGLNGPAETYEAIGDTFGVSRERIRGIEAQAMRKLRSPSRLNRLKGVVPPVPVKVPEHMLPHAARKSKANP